ncbi:MAG TPA: Ldh family oxidoreductase [Devosia sp.]|nr:Ldh family oxidoreductase [Devosia sp.]
MPTASASASTGDQPFWLAAESARALLARLFAAAGVPAPAARAMGEALVDADLEGLPSHGVLQAEVYLDRLLLGSVTPNDTAEIILDRGAMAVLDGHHMLGHLVAAQAMDLAISKARQFGTSVVSVKHAFHFGSAGRYVRQAAAAGCIGIAMCNSRPVMPAPGGAQKLVGTNPLAFGIPTKSEPSIIVDMATSAGTVGRLRVAQKAGAAIPEGWAVDADGAPTTDATAALEGMLLPMGGPKGFGLALVIDMMSGLLASGGWGDGISGLHGDLTKPFNTAHLFMAIDIEHFRPLDGFLDEAQEAATRVRNSKRAPGVERVYTPGERRWESARAADGRVRLQPKQITGLHRLCQLLGVQPDELPPT